MNRLALLIALLISFTSAQSQGGFLFIKSWAKKKRSYSEGSYIHMNRKNGSEKKGIITLLRNDTIFINGTPIAGKNVAVILLDEITKKPFPADLKTMLLISGGELLTGTGLLLNNQVKPGVAFVAASVIGFGPLLVKHFDGRFIYLIRRKKFKLGKKFHMQILDFYLPARKAF